MAEIPPWHTLHREEPTAPPSPLPDTPNDERCDRFAVACSELYDRFVSRGEQPDPFSAKRLYPGLSVADALARIKRLRTLR